MTKNTHMCQIPHGFKAQSFFFLRFGSLITVAVIAGSVEILAQGEKSATDTVRTELAIPSDVRNVEWLEQRSADQFATVSEFNVYHNFHFRDELLTSGIQFEHHTVDDAGNRYKAVHYDHGHGMAVADVDGDNKLDIYFVNQVGPCALWRNQGGGIFQDITAKAGVGLPEFIKAGASFADYDNDGDADLFVTTVRGGNHLFQNSGDGSFTDVTDEAGLNYSGHSSAGVFFDFDRDGFLDLFVSNVGTYTSDHLVPVTNYENLPGAPNLSDREYYDGLPDAFAGHLKPDRAEKSILYRNVDGKRFEDASESTGLVDLGWTGDATPIDANDDGWLDLYVLNMQGHDHYYENQGGKRFAEKTAEYFPKTPWGSMGVKVLDFDNDGLLDIYVTDMHSDMSRVAEVGEEKEKANMMWPETLLRSEGRSIYGNAFFKRESGNKYTEVSDAIGAENFWPWGLSVGDLNADGFDDVFITASMNYHYRYGVNSLLLNNNGSKFLDSEFILGVEPRRDGATAKPWFVLDCDGADKNHRHCKDETGIIEVWGALGSRSSAIFDLDQDGDLDIVTNEFNGPPMVLLSNLAEQQPPNYVHIKLQGSTSNRDGLGAIVTVQSGTNSSCKVHDGKSGYLSQSSGPMYFGLGAATAADKITVRWPSGITQMVAGPFESGKAVELSEPAS